MVRQQTVNLWLIEHGGSSPSQRTNLNTKGEDMKDQNQQKQFTTDYKEQQKNFKKVSRMVRALPDADTKWNPAQKFPRNSDCPCGSQKKYKKCCLHKQPLAVTKETAEAFKTIVDYGRENPDMKFVKPQPSGTQTE